jgi:hypothetical protein
MTEKMIVLMGQSQSDTEESYYKTMSIRYKYRQLTWQKDGFDFI